MFLAASPRIFDTDGSPVHIPKLTGMAEPSWHGETEQVDEVDLTWDEVTLLPSNMASVKSLTPAQQRAGSPVGHRAQAALRDRMVRDVAAKIDTALVAGDGAANRWRRCHPYWAAELHRHTGTHRRRRAHTRRPARRRRTHPRRERRPLLAAVVHDVPRLRQHPQAEGRAAAVPGAARPERAGA